MAADPNANPPVQAAAASEAAGATFQITIAKLYVAVVTLSINDNIKFLENIKKWSKRTISWNKYRFEISV